MIKKLGFAVLAACVMAGTASADLILTGIVDGPLSGGVPKAIELYATADIPDLSIYGLELVTNANSSGGSPNANFSGTLLAGDYYYVASEATSFTSVFGFAPDLTTGQLNHNGDDDLYIYENGVLHDVWSGSDGVDNTGTATDILDSWAYRVDNTGPSTTFDASEWTINAPNTLDGLDAAGTNAALPFGTFTAAAIPEPSAIALLAMFGFAGAVRRRK